MRIFSSNLYFEQQLFSYPNISTVGGMSGVISPTNLSLFSAPVAVNSPRLRHPGVTQPRWNTQTPTSASPFINLEEDYMMTPLMSSTTSEGGPQLLDDGKGNFVICTFDTRTRLEFEFSFVCFRKVFQHSSAYYWSDE